MNRIAKLTLLFAPVGLLVLGGCGKKAAITKQAAAQPPAPPAASAPAATGAGAGAGASDKAQADTTAKLAAAEWALRQEAIKNDPDGQWAVAATASSTYADATGDAQWSANQVVGTPNVEHYTDDGRAWAPKTQDGGIEWLDVRFAKPVLATEVRVRESCGSGAIIRLELFDELGVAHTIWAGADPTTELNYLLIKFPKTTYTSSRVKVTMASNAVSGWNAIDAVQLVGTEE